MAATKPEGYPETPTLDLIGKVSAKTQPAGEFLAWLHEQGYHLTRFEESYGEYYPVFLPIETLLAQWQCVDLDAAGREKMAVLVWARENLNHELQAE